MLAQLYGNVLYQTAAILITTRFLAVVGASPAPAFGDAAPIGSRELLRRTSLPTSIQSPQCQTLFVGQKGTDGEVCLSVQNYSLMVEYTSVTDFLYNEVHLWIGVGTPPTTAPGQFLYTSGNGYCETAAGGTSATCNIPFIDLPEGNLCNTEFSIATHAALGGETGWGDGTCIQEACHPWGMYSTFQFECAEASTSATTTTSPPRTTASMSSSYVRGSTSSNPSSSVWTSPVGTSTTTSVYASATPYYNSSMIVATEMSSFPIAPATTSYISTAAAANSTAPSAFTGGAARLGRGLGRVSTVVAVMGALPALMYM
ncbi:hypothetical protein DL98DRAFT_539063 [Cadophora sp. DSE1049]|nr:hypothetical protein DL98DRAFT_539063 [Cadophora sp. DSE1049]